MSIKKMPKGKKQVTPVTSPSPFKERKIIQLVSVKTETTPQNVSKKSKKKSCSKCGDCEGFTRSSLVEPQKVCNQLGRIASSEACSKFKPDAFRLREMSKEEPWTLKDLSEIVLSTPNSCLGVLGEMLIREKITRKYGYTFFQKVYYHWGGSDNYLSNFASAYILDVRAHRVRLMSWNGGTILTIDIPKDIRNIQEYLSGQVYTVDEYRPLKREMIKKNRKVDTVWEARLQTKIDANLNSNLFNGSIPTIDDFVGDELRKDSTLKKGKKIKDLVDIFQSIAGNSSRKKNVTSVSSIETVGGEQRVNIGNTRRSR